MMPWSKDDDNEPRFLELTPPECDFLFDWIESVFLGRLTANALEDLTDKEAHELAHGIRDKMLVLSAPRS